VYFVSALNNAGLHFRVIGATRLEDAKCLIQQYVGHYNHVRLHSAIGGWMRHASSASYDADKQTTQGSIQRRSRC